MKETIFTLRELVRSLKCKSEYNKKLGCVRLAGTASIFFFGAKGRTISQLHFVWKRCCKSSLYPDNIKILVDLILRRNRNLNILIPMPIERILNVNEIINSQNLIIYVVKQTNELMNCQVPMRQH